MEINELSYAIIGAAMQVHSDLGPGMTESTYEAALAAALRGGGHDVRQQIRVPLTVDNRYVKKAFRVDMIVDETIVVEVKAAKAIGPHDVKQVATYLGILKLPLGLILNFAAPSMRHGIKRVINSSALPSAPPSASSP